MIRTIAGRHNDSIKLARKLQKKKYRREHGMFVVEGFDLIEAALKAGDLPVQVLVRDDLVDRMPRRIWNLAAENRLDIGVCEGEILELASVLGGGSDVIAVYRWAPAALADLDLVSGISVYAHQVGDPGNAGAIVRSAVAFGASGVVFGSASADPFGPKALRAGMGAQFLSPVVTEVTPEDLEARIDREEQRGAESPLILVADAHADLEIGDLAVPDSRGVVLVLGSERGGFPEFRREVQRVAVWQSTFDSLNVAMAATILLYRLARPRRGYRSRLADAPGALPA